MIFKLCIKTSKMKESYRRIPQRTHRIYYQFEENSTIVVSKALKTSMKSSWIHPTLQRSSQRYHLRHATSGPCERFLNFLLFCFGSMSVLKRRHFRYIGKWTSKSKVLRRWVNTFCFWQKNKSENLQIYIQFELLVRKLDFMKHL